ncbi:uncharacterized protein LOC120109029 [Phoenix dactylifera]|uniref:Uncharacterized protein LOC120109029 n=1 Tax=Phoenix dactylifera TaxID=42345 RepID=A0A8B9A608_PHODC|nr:uncharacterized protein LOC120109029 [Phoenix dactylifera]
MAQEILHQTLEIPEDRASGDRSAEDSGDPALSRTASSSRLNAKAPEFVPRSAAADRIDARKPRGGADPPRPVAGDAPLPPGAAEPAFFCYGAGLVRVLWWWRRFGVWGAGNGSGAGRTGSRSGGQGGTLGRSYSEDYEAGGVLFQ